MCTYRHSQNSDLLIRNILIGVLHHVTLAFGCLVGTRWSYQMHEFLIHRTQYNGRPSAIFRACARDDQLHVALACQNGWSKTYKYTSSSSIFDSSQSEKKDRCQITIRTFKRWQWQYNAPHESWLRCDKDPSDSCKRREAGREPGSGAN